MSLTGQRFIGNAKSDTEQYQNLMNEGVNYAKEVGLSLGVAPTEAQLKNLKEDLVWMEEKTVDGNPVLVPVLYLAHEYTKPKGAVIDAKSIKLKVNNNLTNSGTIRTREDMTIDAGSVTNYRGEIRAGGNLNIKSIGDIQNLSGVIQGGQVVLKSTKGNIRNETLSTQREFKSKYGTDRYTNVDKTATISSTNGNLFLDAKKSVISIGANIDSKDAMLLKGNDVNIVTLEEKLSFDYTYGNGHDYGEETKHIQSSIHSGGLLSIIANNNIELEAVSLESLDTYLYAKNDVNILAAIDTKEITQKRESESLFSKNKTHLYHFSKIQKTQSPKIGAL